MGIVKTGGEGIAALHQALRRFPSISACDILPQCVVARERLVAQHLGDWLGGLVVAHTEEGAPLRRADEALHGGRVEIADDLADILTGPFRTYGLQIIPET